MVWILYQSERGQVANIEAINKFYSQTYIPASNLKQSS